MPESAPTNRQQEYQRLTRLGHALSLVGHLQPKYYRNWSDEPNFYAYEAGLAHFLDEQRPHKERNRRDNLALQANGLVIATYWMDVQPSRRGTPTTRNVQEIFKKGNFPEPLVVTPLTRVAAGDRDNPLSDKQRKQLRSAMTFSRLGPLLIDLDPTPRDPDDRYVRMRTHPINRNHIASVLQPVVKNLTDALIAEGHKPFDQRYLDMVDSDINKLRR